MTMSQHRHRAGGGDGLRAGRRRRQRYPGDRRQGAGQAAEGAQLLCGGDDHGRRQDRADPRRAGIGEAGQHPAAVARTRPGRDKAADAAKDARQTLLLFSAGRFPRLVVALSMVARLEEFSKSRVEYAAGLPVLNYRDAILPLVSVGGDARPGSHDMRWTARRFR
jgi:hypothetical protein